MKICNKCGAQNTDDAQFCTGCGAAMNGAPAVAGPNPTAKPPRKKRKAWQIILIVAAVIVVLLIGISIFGGEESESEPESQSQSQSAGSAQDDTAGQGNLGDYDVQVKDARLINYEGKRVIILTYTFTNYDEEPQSFLVSLDDHVYQDGIELQEAYLYDVDGYDDSTYDAQVQTGKSVDVQRAYELSNETSDVEITMEDWLSWSEEKVSFTVSLSDAQQ